MVQPVLSQLRSVSSDEISNIEIGREAKIFLVSWSYDGHITLKLSNGTIVNELETTRAIKDVNQKELKKKTKVRLSH